MAHALDTEMRRHALLGSGLRPESESAAPGSDVDGAIADSEVYTDADADADADRRASMRHQALAKPNHPGAICSHCGSKSSKSSIPPRVLLFSSVAFVLAAAIQLATAWVQMRTQSLSSQCQRHYAPLSASSGSTADSSSGRSGLKLDFEDEYTWLGTDYPPYLPLDLGPPVALTIEDSRHYPLASADASWEWHSLYPGAQLGFLRLGPQKRFFSLALYHQLHCLDSLRRVILDAQAGGDAHGHGHRAEEERADGDDDRTRHAFGKRDGAHASHCLNYLRQTMLCAADVTLEPEIEEGSMNVGEGLAVTHVCRDWSKVHAFATQNFEEWFAYEAQKANRTKAGTKSGGS